LDHRHLRPAGHLADLHLRAAPRLRRPPLGDKTAFVRAKVRLNLRHIDWVRTIVVPLSSSSW
jgi:hypothetical protein